jgi:hypothetical protein
MLTHVHTNILTRTLTYTHNPSHTLSLTHTHTQTPQILELGAGCGLLGLTLARNLPQAGEICLTEQAFGGALDHLRENVDANRAAGTPGAPAVTTAACDWTQALSGGAGDGGAGDGGAAGGGAPEAGSAGGEGQEERCADTARLMSSRWDLILGSDLVGEGGAGRGAVGPGHRTRRSRRA